MLNEKPQVTFVPENKPHPNAGRKQSAEHIAKRVAAKTGVPLSEEHKAKLAAIPHSDERREKNRQGRLKQKNVSDASATLKKFWQELRADPVRYEAYIQKLRNRKVWNKGVPCREETKQKLSAKNKGRSNVALIGKPRPQWLREKMGSWRKGAKLTEEHKAKISAANKARGPIPYESRKRGPDHHNWGKPAPKGSGHSKGSYCKKGHYVRSTWELAVAQWLFDHNIDYTYEATLFDLDGIRYRPDFYVPSMDLYIEIKGYVLEKDLIKHSRFRQAGHKLYVFGKKEFELFQLIEWINFPYLEQLAS